MKSKILVMLVIAASMINISCEEDFNPKAELKNDYVLNCTIGIYNYVNDANGNPPPPSIKAVITRTYDVNGYIPRKPDSMLFIPRANITLFQGLREFAFCDSVAISPANVVRFKYYKLSGGGPTLKGNDKLSLAARMPDGKTLRAETITPRPVYFELSRSFNHGITTNVDKFLFGNALTFSWGDPVATGHLFFPKFFIIYRRIDMEKNFVVEVPVNYLKRNDKYTPVFPGAIHVPIVSFDYSAIDSVMKNLSTGTDPSNVIVYNCNFTVTEYDRNLSAYYSSTNGFMDSYSIRLDENIYSNITGGLGVFGSFVVNREIFPIDKEYIKSFGYKPN